MDCSSLWLLLHTFLFNYIIYGGADDVGYIVYCPCMGRFGNQADHFLGSLAFAKGINRTLILPPWVEYRYGEPKSIQIPFKTYFQVEHLQKYHSVISMEDFMEQISPSIWPKNRRISFCYMERGSGNGCNAKEGNPFGPFWDTFDVDFVSSEYYGPLHYDIHDDNIAIKWMERYPNKDWPVLAFTGAPATFPVQEENRHLHKYLVWSKIIEENVTNFMETHFPRGSFVGIHLRNGVDWVRACEHIPASPLLFSAPQCYGYRGEYGKASKESCLPSMDTIIKHIRRVVRNMRDVVLIYVASDNNHLINELQDTFRRIKVDVMKYPENNPHIDLAILGRANHFIGNCVSSFSAFVKRERDSKGLSSSFWGFPGSKKSNQHDEL